MGDRDAATCAGETARLLRTLLAEVEAGRIVAVGQRGAKLVQRLSVAAEALEEIAMREVVET